MRKFILFTTAILILNFAQAQKISLLPTATGTGANTFTAIVQSGLTKKVNTDSLTAKAFIGVTAPAANTLRFVTNNNRFTDVVITPPASGGTSSYFGDTLFFITNDGNLNLSRLIPINVSEAVKIEVHWIGIRSDQGGATMGNVTNNFFRNGAGAIFQGTAKYPNDDEILGTGNGSCNLIYSNGNISVNVIGQAGTTYNWKLYITLKRYSTL